MKIARFSHDDAILFGIVDETDLVVLSGDPLFAGYEPTGVRVPIADAVLLAPVIPRSKIVCVGKNYHDHAAEMGGVAPEEPLLFLKPNTSVIGPGDTIVRPAHLGADRVRGRARRRDRQGREERVGQADALDYVLGLHDRATTSPPATCSARTVSGREPRASTPSARSAPPSAPTSTRPTATIETRVNGEVRQQAPLTDMIHSVEDDHRVRLRGVHAAARRRHPHRHARRRRHLRRRRHGRGRDHRPRHPAQHRARRRTRVMTDRRADGSRAGGRPAAHGRWSCRSGRCSAASPSARRSRSARCWPPTSPASDALSGLATASVTLGAALCAIPLARLAARVGRRRALTLGNLFALRRHRRRDPRRIASGVPAAARRHPHDRRGQRRQPAVAIRGDRPRAPRSTAGAISRSSSGRRRSAASPVRCCSAPVRSSGRRSGCRRRPVPTRSRSSRSARLSCCISSRCAPIRCWPLNGSPRRPQRRPRCPSSIAPWSLDTRSSRSPVRTW